MENSEFYTLKGYQIKNNIIITNSMEDYIEMIYRYNNSFITVKELANLLNVKPSSVSKMCNKLKEIKLIHFEKYGSISLTNAGKKLGDKLLFRHDTIERFLKYINKDQFKLEQVEKIEHFIDDITLENITKFLQKKDQNLDL